jgi:hypothetical protein
MTAVRDRISPEERAAIDAAIAAGRVQRVAPGQACGLSNIESALGVARPTFGGEFLAQAGRRGAAARALRAALEEKAVA